jgi:hypothetical protein
LFSFHLHPLAAVRTLTCGRQEPETQCDNRVSFQLSRERSFSASLASSISKHRMCIRPMECVRRRVLCMRRHNLNWGGGWFDVSDVAFTQSPSTPSSDQATTS